MRHARRYVPDDVYCEDRVRTGRIWRRADIASEEVVRISQAPGALLKSSRKGVVLHVEGYAVKKSRGGAWRGALSRSLHRGRHRAAWRAAAYLAARGVGVPAPIAYFEDRPFPGYIRENGLISAYLDGAVSAEAQADALLERNAPDQEVEDYLLGLADAVNQLEAVGAVHRDLSGKNILTHGGAQFYFIDLDAVELGRRYSTELRFRNHVQLYDSFCDLWAEDVLRRFLQDMLPVGADAAGWFEAVRRAQGRRRARTEAIWRQQGRPFGRGA